MTDLEYYRSLTGRTIGDFIRGVFKIDNEPDAMRFYAGCVADIQEQIDAGTWTSRCTAEQGARANIGWCFGEGMASERIAMWNRATGSSHPVFGTAMPTPDAAVSAGFEAGKAHR